MKPHVFVNWICFWLLVLLAYAWMVWNSRPQIREGKGINWKKVGSDIKGGFEKGGEAIKDTAQDGWSATEKGLGRAYDYTMDYVDEYGNYFSANLLAAPLNSITSSVGKFVGAMNNVITSVNGLSSSAANLSGNIINKLDPSKPAPSGASGGVQLGSVGQQTTTTGPSGIPNKLSKQIEDAQAALQQTAAGTASEVGKGLSKAGKKFM